MEQMIAIYILVFGLLVVIPIFIRYGFREINLPDLSAIFVPMVLRSVLKTNTITTESY